MRIVQLTKSAGFAAPCRTPVRTGQPRVPDGRGRDRGLRGGVGLGGVLGGGNPVAVPVDEEQLQAVAEEEDRERRAHPDVRDDLLEDPPEAEADQEAHEDVDDGAAGGDAEGRAALALEALAQARHVQRTRRDRAEEPREESDHEGQREVRHGARIVSRRLRRPVGKRTLGA